METPTHVFNPGQNPMQARKRNIERRTGSKNGPTPAKTRRSIFASVDCEKHGTMRAGTRKLEIFTGRSRTKRELYSGCPRCKAERR